MVTNSWFASKLGVCWTLWSLHEKEWKVRVRRRKGRQRKRNGGNNIICCLPFPYTLQTKFCHFVADAAPVLTLGWEGNLDFPQSPVPLQFFRKIIEIERFALRATILVSNVPSLAWRWTWNLLTDLVTPAPSVHMKPKWPPVPGSARSWLSFEKIGDCEQFTRNAEHSFCSRKQHDYEEKAN